MSDDLAPLHDETARFTAALHEAARAIVLEVLTAEYARRLAEGDAEAAPDDDTDAAPVAPVEVPTPAPSTIVAPGSASSERRGRWTHASVIDELCTWLLGGTAVEAAYLRRHGAPGLVAAAKRLFGRFEAALNAANLALAQRYPDGPPSRRAQQRMPAPRPRPVATAPRDAEPDAPDAAPTDESAARDDAAPLLDDAAPLLDDAMTASGDAA